MEFQLQLVLNIGDQLGGRELSAGKSWVARGASGCEVVIKPLEEDCLRAGAVAEKVSVPTACARAPWKRPRR